MKNSKFNSLFQEAYNRYTQGNGFLVGDVVKLKSGYENVESFKKLGENVKQRIKDIIKNGNNIRIGKLHNDTGSRYSAEGANNTPASLADCYEEYAPGLVNNLITLPVECLEEVDTGINLAPVPEGQKDATDRVTGPDEIGKHGWHKGKAVNTQNELGKKQNWVKNGDYKLAEKNTKLANSNKYNDDKPSKVKGLEKPKELKESIEDLYIKILNEDVNVEYYEIPDDYESTIRVNDKPIDLDSVTLDGIELDDPYYTNAYVSSASFTDGIPLTPEELQELSKNKELITSLADQQTTDTTDHDVDVEDEGNEFTGDLAHTQKGDEFEIGGKTVTNTTGQIAEEICPICKMDVCQCNK